jgi:hypothetical protein
MKKYFILARLFLKHYFYNILIGLDQFLGTLLGGSPDVTISGRAWGWHLRGIRLPARLLDKVFGQGHCERAYEPDPTDRSAAWKAREEYRKIKE